MNPVKRTALRQWDSVEILRIDVDAHLVRENHSRDVADALGMVASELLENAVKYGHGDELTLHVFDDGPDVVVEVSHQASDDVALGRALAHLASFVDPAEAYMQALQGVAAHQTDEASGLGLVRIAYEGGCRLSHGFESGRITVRARRPR